MGKDNSAREETRWCHFIFYMHHHTDRIVHSGLEYTDDFVVGFSVFFGVSVLFFVFCFCFCFFVVAFFSGCLLLFFFVFLLGWVFCLFVFVGWGFLCLFVLFFVVFFFFGGGLGSSSFSQNTTTRMTHY